MNKFKTIFFAIFGGIDVVITVITPILLSILWVYTFGIDFTAYVFIVVCGLSAVFRAIKIGWVKK